MRSTRWIRSLLTVILALAALGIACDDDSEDRALDTVRGAEYYEVRVTDEGLEPAEVTLRAPDRAFLVVDNDTSEACRFSLGPWVRDLYVGPGETSSIGFTVVDIDRENMVMGCLARDIAGDIRLLDSTALP